MRGSDETVLPPKDLGGKRHRVDLVTYHRYQREPPGPPAGRGGPQGAPWQEQVGEQQAGSWTDS